MRCRNFHSNEMRHAVNFKISPSGFYDRSRKQTSGEIGSLVFQWGNEVPSVRWALKSGWLHSNSEQIFGVKFGTPSEAVDVKSMFDAS
ncbi:hypothetical protein AVEN_49233-1 [Araneus ventricosus]|uniref:Uncharacterized protein n=1 Tax=Araneus ventricosus TaxID=182803 RepID=A0A4Y2UNM6_ARAVE|nr:hypothetical protein AVEN_49233-1 [Araneus ventricosus]